MKWFWLAVSVSIAGIIGVGWFYVGPGGDGVLAKLELKDGSRFMVTQTYNEVGEPYTVSFYMSMPDGTWGWCYIDHQAARWWGTSLNYDEAADTLKVQNRSELGAVLDRKKKTFTIMTFGSPSERQAPQVENMTPPFDPKTVF